MGLFTDSMNPELALNHGVGSEEELQFTDPAPDRFDAATLMSRKFEPTRFAIPGFCPEGLTILAGRPKLGKSRLALDWSLAVVAGGVAMGKVKVEAGDCLYLALEDSPRRLQGRIRELGAIEKEDLARLVIWTSAPRLDQGLIEQLDEWADGVEDPRLVVIDVFARVRPPFRANESTYDADYKTLTALQNWGSRRRIAVLLVHHTRKAGAEDPLEMLSGTNGLAGGADTVLVLHRDGNGTTLYVRGRDVEENEVALSFDKGAWVVAGDAAVLRQSTERQEILAALEEASEPVSPKQIAEATGMRSANVRALLKKLSDAGDVARVGFGKYGPKQLSDPVGGGHTDNTDHSSPRMRA